MWENSKIRVLMILKIEFENFFSIKDRVRIDFRAANINTALTRELRHNVIDWNGVPVLKSVGLFGPNASGKSNILKTINFCCRMILESHLHNEGAVFNFEPFKFDGWQEKPSSFLIDFVCDNIEYEYSFDLTKTMITTLYKSKTICDDEENFIHNVDDGRRIPDHGTGAGNDDCYRKGTLLGSFRGGAA